MTDAVADFQEATLYDSSLTARQRVRVVGGQLLSDRGSLLRGVTLNIDEQSDFPVSATLFDEIKAAGLNTVHVYLENWSIPTGDRATQAQTIIDLAASAQLYVILGLGGGPPRAANGGSGSFDIEKVRSFWYYYAGRFADRTHVLFEVQNYPDPTCKSAWAAPAMAMEREAYQFIRRIAPSSHIVLMSYGSVPTAPTLTAAIDALSGVDWTNASIAMHGGIDCVALAAEQAVISAARARGIALLVTEVPRTAPSDDVTEYERSRTGWMSTRWLTQSADWAEYRRDYGAPSAKWCPDFGTWPQDASACIAQ